MRRSLPRGPHALPPDVVLADQRERLLVGAAKAVAEHGYADLTVRDLIEQAGVSRRTFYQLFEGKLECVLAAHEAALGRLEKVIKTACTSQVTWPDGVAAAVTAGLEFAVRAPNEARLILIPCHTVSEPKLMGAALVAHRRFEALLREGRKRSEGARPPLELTEPAIAGAVTAIVGARLCAGDGEGLRRLGPELVQIILAPYLGLGRAQRVAHVA
jgi:AcrR family transcriptional regulator